MRTMQVLIDSSGRAKYTAAALRVGENEAVTLEVTFPEEYDDLSHFIRIKLNDNDSYVTPQIVPVERILTYVIPDACTFESGILKMEVQSFNVDDLLVKTSLIMIPVVGSLDGSDIEIPPSYLEYIQILDIIGFYVQKIGDTMTGRLILPELQISGGNGDQGIFSWNTDQVTVDLIQNGTTLQLGQELQIPVYNNTGETIPDGTPVSYKGTTGASGKYYIEKMIADGSVPGSEYLGITTEEIAHGSDGKTTQFGRINEIDTSAFAEGDLLYVSPTVAGELTTTVPTAPQLRIPVAYVIRSHATTGILHVNTRIIHPMDELSDVSISDPQDGDILKYNGTLGVWYNTQP